MRLSAIESGDSYQIRAERILIPTLYPFWAPDYQFGHRVPNWAPNRPTSHKRNVQFETTSKKVRFVCLIYCISVSRFCSDYAVERKRSTKLTQYSYFKISPTQTKF